jgi:hypothetical protein
MAQAPRTLDFDVEDLPIDVFELADSGLEVESLTSGHGMLENGASLCVCSCDYCSCDACCYSSGPACDFFE